MPSTRTPRTRLELAHRGERLVTELSIECDRVATVRETLLEVTHGVAVVADAQECRSGDAVAGARRAQAMNSESSSRSCALPLAPTRRFLTSPSAKTSSVGMLITS